MWTSAAVMKAGALKFREVAPAGVVALGAVDDGLGGN